MTVGVLHGSVIQATRVWECRCIGATCIAIARRVGWVDGWAIEIIVALLIGLSHSGLVHGLARLVVLSPVCWDKVDEETEDIEGKDKSDDPFKNSSNVEMLCFRSDTECNSHGDFD